jgi:hypothetical protein
MTSRLPITRPVKWATDLDATVFEDVDVPLHQVVAASLKRGVSRIQGRTFRGCRLVGPAVVMPGPGTSFDEVNFGDAHGDVRNLVFKPMGEFAVGVIVLENCVIEGCEFTECGFTGSDGFLKSILSLTPEP